MRIPPGKAVKGSAAKTEQSSGLGQDLGERLAHLQLGPAEVAQGLEIDGLELDRRPFRDHIPAFGQRRDPPARQRARVAAIRRLGARRGKRPAATDAAIRKAREIGRA